MLRISSCACVGSFSVHTLREASEHRPDAAEGEAKDGLSGEAARQSVGASAPSPESELPPSTSELQPSTKAVTFTLGFPEMSLRRSLGCTFCHRGKSLIWITLESSAAV